MLKTDPEGTITSSRVRNISWIDPAASAEEARSLCGIDFVRNLMQGQIPPPPVFELLGIRVVRVAQGEVDCELVPAEFHYNPMGGVHGGIISTLLDSVMGLAVCTQLPLGSLFATVELKVNFVRPISVKTGVLLACGNIIHPGSRVATAEARLTDQAGKLYAHSTATCLVLRES
jgi:uncharacterized protein (TIGR00369 family)